MTNHTTTAESTMMPLVVAILTRVFLGLTAGDIARAQAAAIETITDYRAGNSVGLIAVAQIVAFGLAALDLLNLSMNEGVVPPMALRLRANANACNRSAEPNRRALQASQALRRRDEAARDAAFRDAAFASRGPADPNVFLTPEAERMLAAESAARLHPSQNPFACLKKPSNRHIPVATSGPTMTPSPASANNPPPWATAMIRETGAINASIAHLPPDPRPRASMRAHVLGTTAHFLLDPASLPKPGTGPA